MGMMIEMDNKTEGGKMSLATRLANDRIAYRVRIADLTTPRVLRTIPATDEFDARIIAARIDGAIAERRIMATDGSRYEWRQLVG